MKSQLENKNVVACGMIVHELLSNALQHAFPGDIHGNIHVKLKRTTENEAELSISDTGIGLPSAFDIKKDAQLGLKIVQSLVHQLNGKLSFRNAGGSAFIISFPA